MLCVVSVQGVACARCSRQCHQVLCCWAVALDTLQGYPDCWEWPRAQVLQSLGNFSFDLLPQDQTHSLPVCFQPQLQPPLLLASDLPQAEKKIPKCVVCASPV